MKIKWEPTEYSIEEGFKWESRFSSESQAQSSFSLVDILEHQLWISDSLNRTRRKRT
jgi:hypothetical protein